jgi:hypothetical protein
MAGRYPDAERWHAYRAKTDGVPVPPTPWTGPEPAKDGRPYPRFFRISQVPNRLPLHLADVAPLGELVGASC